MQRINNPTPDIWTALCQRPLIEQATINERVQTILARVQQDDDTALKQLTAQFDQVQLQDLRVSENEIQEAIRQVDAKLKAAIQVAYKNIEGFHSAQKEAPLPIETTKGVRCWRQNVAIEKVGLYIPGGSAPLFSTLLMLGIPAQIAGCQEIVICTPPQKNGRVSPVILYVAQLLGTTAIYKVGGAQAIAAMAYGTASISKVDKIFGPGNQYVTAAKQLVQQTGTAIDMPAGPSEVLVVADETCVPSFVAADLLSQAEHGGDSQVILVTTQASIADAVQAELAKQVTLLPRQTIAQQALQNSKIIVLNTIDEAMSFSNIYAPEHLILASAKAEEWVAKVRNAGSVFIGNYSCESAGDYASGTNHTLPTNGFARAYSGVSLDSFVKKITFQQITPSGIEAIGPAIEAMAAAEGLEAHKNAVTIRLEQLKKQAPTTSETALPIRPSIQKLKPYSSARSEFTGTATVFLDANESPFDNGLNRYPDPKQWALKERIADLKNTSPENLFLGNGSDEALDLIFKTFCEPKRDKALCFSPTYGMYQVIADVQEVELIKVPLTTDFQIDKTNLDAYLQDSRIKLICICSPNNPTGNLIPKDDILYIIKRFHGMVLVDEAYIDFAPSGSSMLPQLADYPNLIVLQTFSKAWGLAGLRLGMAFAKNNVIEALNKIKLPYNINTLTQQKALSILENPIGVQTNIKRILAQRTFLEKALLKMDKVIKIYPSAANFLLVQFKDANAVYQQMLKEGIVLRNRAHLIDNCLRISIGTPQENELLIQTLKAVNVEPSIQV